MSKHCLVMWKSILCLCKTTQNGFYFSRMQRCLLARPNSTLVLTHLQQHPLLLPASLSSHGLSQLCRLDHGRTKSGAATPARRARLFVPWHRRGASAPRTAPQRPAPHRPRGAAGLGRLRGYSEHHHHTLYSPWVTLATSFSLAGVSYSVVTHKPPKLPIVSLRSIW